MEEPGRSTEAEEGQEPLLVLSALLDFRELAASEEGEEEALLEARLGASGALEDLAEAQGGRQQKAELQLILQEPAEALVVVALADME
jgi:hypothetical protein